MLTHDGWFKQEYGNGLISYDTFVSGFDFVEGIEDIRVFRYLKDGVETEIEYVAWYYGEPAKEQIPDKVFKQVEEYVKRNKNVNVISK